MLSQPGSLARKLNRQALGVGGLFASAVLCLLLYKWGAPGLTTPPRLVLTQFSVAMLAGPKQAEQTAPADVVATAADVAVVEPVAQAPTEIVVAKRETSLPDAVVSAQAGQPSKEIAKKEEVIAPARLSMPGGRLAVVDAPMGDGGAPDPFAIAADTVYLKLFVDSEGRVVRGGIARSGGDSLRDAFILKAMKSRRYDISKLPAIVNGETKEWMVAVDISYSNNELLP